MMRRVIRAILLVLVFATPALAQDHHGHQHDAPMGPGWTWAPSARVYFGANVQERKFTDFYYVESQN